MWKNLKKNVKIAKTKKKCKNGQNLRKSETCKKKNVKIVKIQVHYFLGSGGPYFGSFTQPFSLARNGNALGVFLLRCPVFTFFFFLDWRECFLFIIGERIGSRELLLILCGTVCPALLASSSIVWDSIAWPGIVACTVLSHVFNIGCLFLITLAECPCLGEGEAGSESIHVFCLGGGAFLEGFLTHTGGETEPDVIWKKKTKYQLTS